MGTSSNISLETMIHGAVKERFELELAKVFDNIGDPNTSAKEVRKLTLFLTLKPNENRDSAEISIKAATKLAEAKELTTTFFLDRDNQGKVIGAERQTDKGQTYLDDDGEMRDDIGDKVRRIH